jgi:hypothetical protein
MLLSAFTFNNLATKKGCNLKSIRFYTKGSLHCVTTFNYINYQYTAKYLFNTHVEKMY